MSKTEKYTELFRQLCDAGETDAFVAITIDSEMMTSFACAGIDSEDAAEVLEQMADYLRNRYKSKEKNDSEPTKH